MAILANIPNKLDLDWNYVVITEFIYDAINLEARAMLNLYESEASFNDDKGRFVKTTPSMEFNLSLDPNWPFEALKKKNPNLTIVANPDPENPDVITQEELTAQRDNYQGYILSLAEVSQLFTGDTTALLYTHAKTFINETWGIPLNEITIV